MNVRSERMSVSARFSDTAQLGRVCKKSVRPSGRGVQGGSLSKKLSLNQPYTCATFYRGPFFALRRPGPRPSETPAGLNRTWRRGAPGLAPRVITALAGRARPCGVCNSSQPVQMAFDGQPPCSGGAWVRLLPLGEVHLCAWSRGRCISGVYSPGLHMLLVPGHPSLPFSCPSAVRGLFPQLFGPFPDLRCFFPEV